MITIASDIENLGPIQPAHTSLFKAKNKDGEVTIVKVLPFSVRFNDEHFLYFQQALEKLRQVHREFGTSIPRIISSGITLTGSFPYYQMEFIEGTSLEELTKERQQPLFTISELINLAERVSWTLLHCHNAGIIHGDIKDTTILFNEHTGKYTLVGFGTCFLTGEQQQTYTKLESHNFFAAPEKQKGTLLFETDVYQIGVLLYLLLTGVAPPKEIAGESYDFAQRALAARRVLFPETWLEEEKERETLLPSWFLPMIEKCLHQRPEDRFYSGVDLYNHILFHHKFPVEKKVRLGGSRKKAPYSGLKKETLKPAIIRETQTPLTQWKKPLKKGTSGQRRAVLFGAFALIAVVAFALIYFNNENNAATYIEPDSTVMEVITETTTDRVNSTISNKETPAENEGEPTAPVFVPEVNTPEKSTPSIKSEAPEKAPAPLNSEVKEATNRGDLGAYKVRSRAYFHNQPDEQTRRAAFIVHWNNAVLRPLKEENDFVYIVFTNAEGQTSKGWLRKKDLIPVSR